MISEMCAICGRRWATCTHHLIYGQGLRNLADQDKLTLELCDDCHTMTQYSIHGNPVAGQLSKMCGQLMYESKMIEQGMNAEAARGKFMERYGRSWL